MYRDQQANNPVVAPSGRRKPCAHLHGGPAEEHAWWIARRPREPACTTTSGTTSEKIPTRSQEGQYEITVPTITGQVVRAMLKLLLESIFEAAGGLLSRTVLAMLVAREGPGAATACQRRWERASGR